MIRLDSDVQKDTTGHYNEIDFEELEMPWWEKGFMSAETARLEAFARCLFAPFFRWWAAITGFCSIVALYALPRDGVTVAPWALASLLLLFSLLLFLCATVVYQGWKVFSMHFGLPQYVGVKKHDQYHQGVAILLECLRPIQNGTLLELRRNVDGAECLAAVLEVVEANAKGQLQAQCIWFSPGHLKDLRQNKVESSALNISPSMSRRSLDEVRNSENLES